MRCFAQVNTPPLESKRFCEDGSAGVNRAAVVGGESSGGPSASIQARC